MNDKKVDEAIKVLMAAIQRFPESANLQDSLGEALVLKGDKAGAHAAYSKALALAKTPAVRK